MVTKKMQIGPDFDRRGRSGAGFQRRPGDEPAPAAEEPAEEPAEPAEEPEPAAKKTSKK